MRRAFRQGDILTGNIPTQLILFFLPVWFGTFFQQLYNTADTLIVGNYVGTQALAAVGATGALTQLLIGIFTGLCSGASVVVAQSFGARDTRRISLQVHTSIALAIAGGVLLMVLGIAGARGGSFLDEHPRRCSGRCGPVPADLLLGYGAADAL